MNIFWYMCAPDGAYPWQPEGSRKVDLGYYKQLALAYDQLGYTGALFATGAHDVWVLAGALLSHTERLKLLVAIHPGLIAPTLLGKMAATLQEFSRGRLLINVVSGDAKMLGAYGMTMPHDERYEMADEYLQIWHRLFAGETVDFKGQYFQTEGAKLALPVGQGIEPPPLWFGGSSDKAIDVAAKHVETYLSWGETPDQIGAKVDLVKARAEKLGRELEYGIRLYVIVRDTDEEAWAAAADLYGRMDANAIAANQRFVGKTDSVGQQRMTAMHGGQKPENLRDLEIAPNLWAGIGLVRPGPGTAIVGSPDTVIRTLEAYKKAGVNTFILSGMPLLEEAFRFGEKVLPRIDVSREVSSAKQFTWSTLFDRDLSAKAS
ncbi:MULTISPECIES: LLM class flavin-dependent oxidoreductase [Agrobacterium tumefaciens complex]|jgi:alkanesulfonate monooxygenase|uniref:Alkanesulfonate monooxygenase n=2 Tax=Agrobacterium tumefaciens complex TaxID=1183400 RepID=A0A1S7RJ25_AGRTU|nr:MULTISPECIES: LLM class flavin-dependent oxidoreductase [Agrobacterium tumefaciens complex]TGE79505.1 LLM class flavin-dependent oxidoreductase [Rhizobium sp. SEMIA 439]AYM83058.1 alkanesulfonate monooxygenase [Agrobacterium tumefaciens]EPR23108.1 alkanesulfonate monooxygenase [Agrobacterium radiobacter DSM 30147]KAB0461177.1 LLM class flavin-dependent oxidoreductase [Agrobacterium tumefaciens]KWT77482.1 alkanesulfonate monooxygenase [Agrobacterium radiobacter]